MSDVIVGIFNIVSMLAILGAFLCAYYSHQDAKEARLQAEQYRDEARQIAREAQGPIPPIADEPIVTRHIYPDRIQADNLTSDNATIHDRNPHE